jgi:hypothetical protein
LKLGDAYEYLKSIISSRQNKDETYDSVFTAYTKIGYALNYQLGPNHNDFKLVFGKQFHQDHPIFKSYFNEQGKKFYHTFYIIDDNLVQTYIKALQVASKAVSNLSDADPFNLTCTMMDTSMSNAKIQQRVVHQRSSSAILSHGSDPVAVTATYMIVPDSFIVVSVVIL